MQQNRRSIFRSEAVAEYIKNREQAVLPRFITPQIFCYLWGIVGLLMLSGLLAWFIQIPTHTEGTAQVIRGDGELVATTGMMIVALFPPDMLERLLLEQTIFIRPATQTSIEQSVSQPIILTEPKVLSPKIIQSRFGLNVSTFTQQPSTVVVAALEQPLGNLPESVYEGATYSVMAETGSYRLLTLIPGLGSFLEVN